MLWEHHFTPSALGTPLYPECSGNTTLPRVLWEHHFTPSALGTPLYPECSGNTTLPRVLWEHHFTPSALGTPLYPECSGNTTLPRVLWEHHFTPSALGTPLYPECWSSHCLIIRHRGDIIFTCPITGSGCGHTGHVITDSQTGEAVSTQRWVWLTFSDIVFKCVKKCALIHSGRGGD